MRRHTAPLLVAGLMVFEAVFPGVARGQNRIPAALIGGVAGVGSGGYIAISVIVAESRAGKYMHSYADALGWHSAPVLIGGVGGVGLGLYSPDRLKRTVIYGSVGTLAGTGIGAVLGKILWEGPEAKWAGGAIGAGLGMAIGCTLGVFLPIDKEGEADPVSPAQAAARIPLSFTIRF